MGISILDNFDYRAGKPNFTRDLFATEEEMVAFPEMYLPSVFEFNVTDTGDRYRYNVNNDVDPVTGKWRLVTGGTGGSVDGYTKGEVNTLLNKKLDKPETDGTEGQVLTVQADGTNAYADVPTYDDTELRELIGDIPIGNLNYEIVETLPEVTSDEAKEHTLYMIKSESDDTGYNQYIIVDGVYKKVGSTTSGTGGASTASEVSYNNEALSSVLDVKMALDTIIAKIYYVAPSITSFTCTPSQTAYEVGAKIPSIKFNWTYNKEIDTQTLTDCTLADNTVREATYSTELSTNKTFTLNVSDGTNSTSKSIAFTFDNVKIYYGASTAPTNVYTDSFLYNLKSVLKTNKSGTYTANAITNNYFYIAIPRSLYSENVLVGKVGGFDTEFNKVGTVVVTNVNNVNIDYYIYRSTNHSLGNITVII